MIITKLTGSLGNQMFQIALGHLLCNLKRTTLFVDTDSYSWDTLRTYESESFWEIQAKQAGNKRININHIDFNSQNTPIVTCIETISFSQTGRGIKNKTIIEYLESKNYHYYADTNINSIFVRCDKWEK